MLAWTVLSDEDAAESWNALTLHLEDASPFHTFEFGQYYQHLGWHPMYCACFDNNRHVVAMALCLTKTVFGRITIGWCFGGPIGLIATWADLPGVIARSRGTKHIYIRFRCDRARNDDDVRTLLATKWTQPNLLIGRNLTLVLDLSVRDQDLLAGFSKNWRRNLRRAEEQNITIACNEEAISLQLFDAYREMAEFKNFGSLLEFEKLKRLVELSGQNIAVFVARDADGNLLAFRCVLILGKKAVDYLAATTMRGRQLHAAYLLLRAEIISLKARGVEHYDLGGIDPETNPGVYRFKRDTGGRQVVLLGEWERANSAGLCAVVNLALRARATFHRIRRYLTKSQPTQTRETS